MMHVNINPRTMTTIAAQHSPNRRYIACDSINLC